MDSSEDSQRGWYTKFWLPAVVGFGAASAGFLWLLYRQLRSLNRTRDLKVMLEILDRHEDPALFKTRHFVYHHMQEVNSFLEELDPTDLGSTDRIDNRIRELSKDEACLEHLLRLINVLNHTSMLIENGLLSRDLEMEFSQFIVQLRELLQPFINYERIRRKDRLQWYAKHFEALADRMKSAAYRSRLEKIANR